MLLDIQSLFSISKMYLCVLIRGGENNKRKERSDVNKASMN